LVSHIKRKIQAKDVGEQCAQTIFRPRTKEAMGVEMINAYRDLARKPEGNKPF